MRVSAWRSGVLVVAACLMCGVSLAQDSDDDIIHDRITNFRDIGAAYKSIGDELKSGRPDIGHIRTAARTIAGYGPHVASWFPPGSEPPPKPPKSWYETLVGWFTPPAQETDTLFESHAKPEIWTQTDLFRRDAWKLSAAAEALNRAAQAGDLSVIASRYRELGGACNACHRTFREKLH